jgi:hypothetical protein
LFNQSADYNNILERFGRDFSSFSKQENVSSIDTQRGSSFLTFEQPTE